MLRAFPRLKLVAAHFGGNRQWDEVERLLIGQPVWLDTSLTSLFALDPAQFTRMIRRHDGGRILFGSDLPWCDPSEALRYIEALRLPSELLEKILAQNALALLGEAAKTR